jgi:endonuclease/exonuclease/phosphatase (EEP) superfamily protein YafD
MLLLEIFSQPILYTLAILVLTFVVLLTLASHFGRYIYLELTTHFRLQYFWTAVLCGLVFTAYQSWQFVLIALACACLNLYYIWPYYRSKSKRGSDSEFSLRVLHANVLKGNTNYAAVFELINQVSPDLVFLQETGDAWRDQLEPLRKEYPFYEAALRPHGAGMIVLSRKPFDSVEVLALDESQHVAILARVNLVKHSITVLGLHPTTPIDPFKFRNRNLQFREAASLLNKIDGHKILIGDLNTTMWSPYFEQLTRDANLRDARLGFGLKTSWPMPLPSFLRMPIDHCLISQELRVEAVEISAHIGSDHRPLIVDIFGVR